VITRTGECDLDTGKEFWDRVRKFFISLPMFRFDRTNITVKNIWISFFKNLGDMENIDPSVYERADEGLLRLIEKAKVSALSEEEYDQYEASMKYLEDEIDMEQHGYERGMEEGLRKGTEQGLMQGLKQGKLEGEKTANLRNAKKMRQKGLDVDDIAEITGLSLEDIEKL
ncbi:MAG: PD-(D/E)XK nuclease family transposase, partial [Paludibacteraceae bacterium]|nr:PD-(D/E)XK nuclease family transposase [Paludibacteraceae bacterium]